jgi:hypothetical protein
MGVSGSVHDVAFVRADRCQLGNLLILCHAPEQDVDALLERSAGCDSAARWCALRAGRWRRQRWLGRALEKIVDALLQRSARVAMRCGSGGSGTKAGLQHAR